MGSLDPDAQRAVFASARRPELSAGGDEERVVSARRHRDDGFIEIVEGLDEARPRNAALPPRGGGEGDVAETELAVAARAPGPHAAAIGEAQRVRPAGDGVHHAHPSKRLEALERPGVVEVSVAELAVSPATARPQTATLRHDDGVIGAGGDLRHLDVRHRRHPSGHVHLDGCPPAVSEFAAAREPPREKHAVRVERRAVRRAARHRLDGRGIREPGTDEAHRGGLRRVVVPALPELPVESPTEGVQRAPVRLLPRRRRARRRRRRGSDNLAIVRIVAVDAIRAAETVDDGREHGHPVFVR